MSEVLEAAWWGEASRRAGRVAPRRDHGRAGCPQPAACLPFRACLSAWCLAVRCLSACAAHRPNRASPCAARADAAVRALHNRKIAFGRVLLAPPSLFAKAARLAGSMRRAVGTSAGCGSRRRCARGPRDSSALVCAIHPPPRGGWLGRDTSLRQPPPFRRRLAHPGVLARSRSRPRRLAPCPLSAHARRYGASVAACAYP